MLKKQTIIVLISIVLISILVFCLTLGIVSNKNKNKEIVFPYVSGVPASFPVDKTSNIVFSVDKKYKEYLKVAIKSAIVNKNKDSYYNIYILCVDLSKKDRDSFKVFESDKVKINTVELKLGMLKNVGNYKILGRSHVSRTDLFKFFIPKIFKDLDRILYIDSDTLILKDLSKIYNYSLENKLIGAVQELHDNKKTFGFNCGVILYNIKNCNKENITEKLIEAKNKDKTRIYVTQSFFREIIKENEVAKMPFEFNRFSSTTQKEFKELNYKELFYSNNKKINSLEDADKNTIIIHFLAYKKPWQYDKINFANLWWEYAKTINPNWKAKKRNKLQNLFLAIELTMASNKERKFENFDSALHSAKREYRYLNKEKDKR